MNAKEWRGLFSSPPVLGIWIATQPEMIEEAFSPGSLAASTYVSSSDIFTSFALINRPRLASRLETISVYFNSQSVIKRTISLDLDFYE